MRFAGFRLGYCSLLGWAAIAVLILAPFRTSLRGEGGAGPGRANIQKQTTRSGLVESYGNLPLSFEVNRGQTDSQVKFLSHGHGYSLFLTSGEAVLALKKPTAVRDPRSTATQKLTLATGGGRGSTEGFPGFSLIARHLSLPSPAASAPPPASSVVRMKLVGADPNATVMGLEELPGKSNYFIGNDPKKWRTNVANYGRVKYTGVYPGVDLIYYGNQQQLEYDFVLAPGADPNSIRLNFRGAGNLTIDKKGDLLLEAEGEEVRLLKPVVYQEARGEKKPIEGSYVLASANRIGFRLGKYDHNCPLVIDPVLAYSTYLGGNLYDNGSAIAVDSLGNAYVTGTTDSTNFPTVNALKPSLDAYFANAFVTKINASGSALVYSTYLGGGYEDEGHGIAVDASGNAYVTGFTFSDDFPTVNALQPNLAGNMNGFVAKINASGSALVYSTYLGGNSEDEGGGIAVDAAGNTYVSGSTNSTNFPTANALQPTFGGGSYDAFVAKFNTRGSALVYSTYLGGSEFDSAGGIAVDASGNAYLTGTTDSTNFPKAKALQPALAGNMNGFVTKINASGSALVYSTYLGGNSEDEGDGIAVDAAGNAYVTGSTSSTNFPTAHALQPALAGNENAFVTKINASGSALVYSTYLGGNSEDEGGGIAVDAVGNAYVTGSTSSTNFPTANALQPTFGGGSYDAFVAKFNTSGSALVYSTYLGGKSEDEGGDIAVDAPGIAYVIGTTTSTSFPMANALQPTLAGSQNAFVTKIAEVSYASLASLVKQYESNRLIENIMLLTLQRAQSTAAEGEAAVTDSLLKAFIEEVTGAESIKSLTAPEAALLIKLAKGLMM